MNRIKDIIDVIEEINIELSDKHQDLVDEFNIQVVLVTTGLSWNVDFLGCTILDSDMDCETEGGDFLDVKECIRLLISNFINRIKVIEF